MWFRSFIDLLTSSPRRKRDCAADRKRLARRLLLEGMELRTLMAFNPFAAYPTGADPHDVVLADVNGDNRADLLVANAGSSSVDVRLGSGDGGFGPATSYSVARPPSSLAVGDVTGDGNADVVVAISDLGGSALAILEGNGNGAFVPLADLPLPQERSSPSSDFTEQSLSSVAMGDLNHDGSLDLVATGTASFYYSYYGTSSEQESFANVLIGTGGGGFSAPVAVPLGSERVPGAVAVEDINADGNADIVAGTDHGMLALLGDGSGSLSGPIHSGFGSSLRSLSFGDIDSDGNQDSLSFNGFGVNVQNGNGDGSFTTQPSLSINHPVQSAALGDVNADGKLDVVAVGANTWLLNGQLYTNRRATVLLGNGQAEYSFPITTPLSGIEEGTGDLADMALADLTGDGLPDLVAVNARTGEALVAINGGDWVARPSASISDAEFVVEGNSGAVNAVFTVTITGDHGDVAVNYATSDATAVAGLDYTATSGTLSFSAGESSKTISVPVLGDTLYEGSESFGLGVGSPGGELGFTDSQGSATIVDDDPAPLLSINDVSKDEGNTGISLFIFTVSLSAPSVVPVDFDFQTSDGTSTLADHDYHYLNSEDSAFRGHIEPGQTSAIINIEVLDDTKIETDETFFVNLFNVAGATIADGEGIGTIINDDGTAPPSLPAITISDAEVVEGNSGVRQMTFTVSLSHASGQEVLVKYATANGTAKTRNNDYLASSGTIRFAPGQTTKSITITITGDTKKESDEYFKVKLSHAVKGTIVDSQGVGTILNDDGISARSRWKSYAAAFDAALDDFFSGRLNKRHR